MRFTAISPAAQEALTRGRRRRGAAGQRMRGALGHHRVLDVESLVREHGVSDADAIALLCALVATR